MSTESEDLDINQNDSIEFKQPFSDRQVFVFSNGGLLFVFGALGCIAGLVWHLIRAGNYGYKPYM